MFYKCKYLSLQIRKFRCVFDNQKNKFQAFIIINMNILSLQPPLNKIILNTCL